MMDFQPQFCAHSQPENFYLLAVISAPATLLLLLDYVLNGYLSNIIVYSAVSLLCLFARSKLGNANTP